ncbi:MAG TPA: ferritin family protein [Thermodesulfobacteriota bacterium]|nr:ferritin family protein [Thermodesulfobacteriota bacterium]
MVVLNAMMGKSEEFKKGSRDKRTEGEDGMRDKRRLSTPDEILNAALAKERQSRVFYAGLAEQCQIEMVKGLLEKLKDEENKHVKMIEEMMANLRLGRSPV